MLGIFLEFSEEVGLNIKISRVIRRTKRRSPRWRVGDMRLEEPKKQTKNAVNIGTHCRLSVCAFRVYGQKKPLDELRQFFGNRLPGRIKFGNDRLRGQTSKFTPFPLEFAGRPYNSATLSVVNSSYSKISVSFPINTF